MADLFEHLLYAYPEQGSVLTTEPVEIPGLEGQRPLTLYLPPDYEIEPTRYYPVAYLFDGQNLYDTEGTWPQGWQLHRILDQRWAEELTIPIVVGIHHGHNRDEELCPWPAEKGQTPRGDDLLYWIRYTLHPQLLEQLRILEGPENTLLGGSSLGGLLALYGCFSHSDFFGQAMSMSPSLWVGDGAIYEYIAQAELTEDTEDMRLYIDCGQLEDDEEFEPSDFEYTSEQDESEEEFTEEEPNIDDDGDNEESWDSDPHTDAEYMVGLLEAKGLEDGAQFLWISDPEGEHNEYHWSKRLPIALHFLYD